MDKVEWAQRVYELINAHYTQDEGWEYLIIFLDTLVDLSWEYRTNDL